MTYVPKSQRGKVLDKIVIDFPADTIIIPKITMADVVEGFSKIKEGYEIFSTSWNEDPPAAIIQAKSPKDPRQSVMIMIPMASVEQVNNLRKFITSIRYDKYELKSVETKNNTIILTREAK